MSNKKFTEKEFESATIFLEKINDEVKKPNDFFMFMGAWYHKCISSKDKWLGIEATVTLPEFYPDRTRLEFFEHKGSFNGKPLKPFLRCMDSPSVYVGGNAGYESDIGFAYAQGFLDPGFNVLSMEKICFRPFWRYIVSNNDGSTQNIYKSTAVNEVKYYFYPGDKLILRVYSPEENFLRMDIELVEPTKIMKYRKMRRNLGVDENEKIVFNSPLIESKGQGVNFAEYKRVNAIDQFYNEGKNNKNTDSYTTPTIWHEVYLYRKINDKIMKVPFTEERYFAIDCPVKESVIKSNKFTNKALGGEEVSIDPRNTLV